MLSVSEEKNETVSPVMAFGYAFLYHIGRAQAIRVASGGAVAWDTKISHDSSGATTGGDRDYTWRDELEP